MRITVGAACAIATAALVGGCTPPPAPPVSTTRVYAVDLAGGAKLCTVTPPKPVLVAGKTTAVAMRVANDGGWCAVSVAQAGPHPYDAGLLTGRPAHGTVYIHSVGDDTRIDYTPDRGFAGTDGFTVSLVPDSPVLHAAVMVALPGSSPPTVAAPRAAPARVPPRAAPR
jgi:hypothetical protein